MSDALVTQLARALNLPPDAARHTLNHLITALHEQLDATGRAKVPGLGTFRRDEAGLSFHPDDTLARAVNHRYAGLQPIEAGPHAAEDEPEDPFARAAPSAASEPEAAETTVGFQPLDTYLEPEDEIEEPEDEAESERESEDVDEVSSDPFAPTLTDVADEEVASSEFPLEEDTSDEEWRDKGLDADEKLGTDAPEFEVDEGESEADVEEPREVEEPTMEEPPVLGSLSPAELDEEAEEDHAIAEPEPVDKPGRPGEAELEPGAEAKSEPEAEPEVEPEDADVLPAADPESEGLDNLDDLLVPARVEAEDDEADDDLEATDIFPAFSTPPSPTEAPEPEAAAPGSEPESPPQQAEAPPLETPPAEPRTVAPAVAATSRPAADRKAKTPAPDRSRGVPIVPILIGVLAVLGLAALLWLLNREPDGPVVADQPTPLDTTTAIVEAPPTATDTVATSAPTDTAAVAEPPAEPVAADPLQGSAPIDPEAGGWTWVVASEASEGTAERRAARYREQGLRTGVIAGDAGGATRYRVGLGQFQSLDEANRFRSDLPADVPSGTWLLQL